MYVLLETIKSNGSEETDKFKTFEDSLHFSVSYIFLLK